MLNNELSIIQNDVNESVKNMIHNVNDFEEMEIKSSKIRDISIQFQRDSLNLKKKITHDFSIVINAAKSQHKFVILVVVLDNHFLLVPYPTDMVPKLNVC